jgi:hypothetical protein
VHGRVTGDHYRRAVLSPYRSILALPGALAFSGIGLFARLEIAMVGLGTVLLVQRTSGSYALGGAVSATYGVSAALVAPWIARRIARHGQARVLRSAIPLHALFLLALIGSALLQAPAGLLFGAAALTGGSQVSVGSLVRARWAVLLGGTPGLQTAFALEAVIDEMVFIVGPIIVTLLATLVHPAVGLLVALATAVIGTLILAAQERTQPPHGVAPTEAQRTGPKPTSVLRMRGMGVLVVVFLTTGGIFGAAEVSVAATTKAAGVPAAAGLILAAWSLGSMLAGLAFGAVAWRGSPQRRLVVVTVLLALLTAPMLIAPTVPLLGLAFFVAGLAIAPVITAGSTVVELLVPAHKLTEGLAWTNTALGLTYALSTAVAGVVVDAGGPHAGFVVPVASAAIGGLAALVGVRRLYPRSSAAAD